MDTTYRVGLAIPLQGPGGIFGPSCRAVAELAAEQINGAGGITGRKVSLEIVDAGRDPRLVRDEVEALVVTGRVQAVTGWHISPVRQFLAPALHDRVPYVYTSLYEGGPVRNGVFCSGETPDQQVAPALEWLRDEVGIRRWALVGADYIWPRVTARRVVRFARQAGLEIVEESYVRYGCPDFSDVLCRITASSAEAVLMLLVGQDAVVFNRQFSNAGLQSVLPRFSPLMEENMLLASGAGGTDNLYVAAAYFNTLATTPAMDFLASYTARFGPNAPALNNAAESCYEGMMALAGLTSRARSTHIQDIASAADEAPITYEGPRGPVTLRGGRGRQQIHIARADGLTFDVLAALPQDSGIAESAG